MYSDGFREAVHLMLRLNEVELVALGEICRSSSHNKIRDKLNELYKAPDLAISTTGKAPWEMGLVIALCGGFGSRVSPEILSRAVLSGQAALACSLFEKYKDLPSDLDIEMRLRIRDRLIPRGDVDE